MLFWLASASTGVGQLHAQAAGKAGKGAKAPAAAAAAPASPAPPAAGPATGAGATKSTDRIAPSVNFDRLSYAEGLPNSHVKAIIQDKLGFIWFGTGDGLARYDGARMRVYKHSDTDATSLSGAFVTALSVDKDGKLWAGTADAGVSLYDPETDKFTRFPMSDPAAKGAAAAAVGITGILRDAKDRMWFATSSGGLSRFDPATKAFVVYVQEPLDAAITSLDADAKGNLWLGTATEGLIRWNPDDGSSEVFKPGETQGIPSAPITSVLASSAGPIWFGSDGEGLASFDPTSRKLNLFRHVADDPSTLSDDHVSVLFEDKNKVLWIGTTSGLNRMDDKGAIVQYHHDRLDPLSLSFPEVEAHYQDLGGVMWVGGFTVGASKFVESRAKFGRVRTATHPANSFYEDGDGTLWVGTYHGGLYKYEFGAQRVTHYDGLGTKGSEGALDFESTWITTLHRDKKGTLWMGTQGQGLVAFDTKNETFRRYLPNPDQATSLPVDTVWALDEDEGGVLWLGTGGGGLVKFDTAKDEFNAYTTQDSIGLTSDNIVTLYRDPTAKIILWAGTAQGGLIQFDTVASTAKSFRHKADDPNSIGNDDVFSIYRDPSGSLWLGTGGGGLNKLDPMSGKAVRFTTTNSKLTNDTIYGLLPDADGNLWLSTNGGGLVQYDPKANKFTAYDVPDGVQGNEFGQGAFMRSASGKLYFGGVDGFNAFNPKDITRDTYVPPVVLTGFEMFNQDAKLAKPVWFLNKVGVSYSDSFEIQFAALTFAAPSQTRYAYKLDGLDAKWIETDRPFASYTKLDGGSYTLHVKAANRHGVWNETGTTLKIAVKPPFYRTWPAYLVYMLLLVGAVFLVFYFQRQRVRRVIREGRLAVVERDLALTGAVQNGFLPEYNEITGGRVQLFGFYRGADSCSGDWWWHEMIGGRHIVLVGDVTGHGPGPAMVTAAVASAFRLLVTETGIGDLLDTLLTLNRVVLQVAKGKYSMTMAAFELDELTGQWILYNAGAPPMITLSAGGKHRVHFAAGTPLGTESGFEAGRLEGRLQSQERVLIYTDGIPEIMLPSGQALGMRRLGQMYERTRQQELRDAAGAIVQQADLTQSGKPQDDDWTFALVEWRSGNTAMSAATAHDMGEYGG
jgi:ligand-binding sensor domain-containing protein